MVIHLYKFNESPQDIETTRITMLESGEEKFHIPGRVLVIGTTPNTKAVSFKDIKWFWIEEN